MQSTVTIVPNSKTTRAHDVNGKRRVETYYTARCTCGCQWPVRSDRVKHVRSCQTCSQRAKGKKGYAATKAKYGERFALRWWREWRMENPTCLERTVAGWLDELGVDYEREYWFETGDGVFLLDFLVNCTFAVEVHGAYWHDMASGMKRDARKAEALDYAEFTLLTLSEDDVTSGRGFAKLQAALRGICLQLS